MIIISFKFSQDVTLVINHYTVFSCLGHTLVDGLVDIAGGHTDSWGMDTTPTCVIVDYESCRK